MATRFKPKSPFELTRGIEARYAMQLRRLAVKIGSLVARFPDPLNSPAQRTQITMALNEYANLITPWAQALATKVVRQVDLTNRNAYEVHAGRMSDRLRYELRHAPTGEMMRLMQAEQVELIRSMPVEAAQRVQEIALKNLANGTRAAQFAAEIANTTGVTKSRANLIARTETSRTSANLTMSRAMYVGSVEYSWLTAHDSDVRPSHRAMEGKRVFWANPPTLDGLRGHAGCLPNCRCTPLPILPEER